jgi:hypothetical protein
MCLAIVGSRDNAAFETMVEAARAQAVHIRERDGPPPAA